MLALVKTAALVVILFLIMALLSRMSAPELQLDVGVQHSVKKLVSKSQEAAAQTQNQSHPVHMYLHSTNALSQLDAALTLVTPKQCETLTGCKVNELYNHLVQAQEAAANALYFLQHPPLQHQTPQFSPPSQPVQANRRA